MTLRVHILHLNDRACAFLYMCDDFRSDAISSILFKRCETTLTLKNDFSPIIFEHYAQFLFFS